MKERRFDLNCPKCEKCKSIMELKTSYYHKGIHLFFQCNLCGKIIKEWEIGDIK